MGAYGANIGGNNERRSLRLFRNAGGADGGAKLPS
jgi:hypothetical protein